MNFKYEWKEKWNESAADESGTHQIFQDVQLKLHIVYNTVT